MKEKEVSKRSGSWKEEKNIFWEQDFCGGNFYGAIPWTIKNKNKRMF